METRLRQGTSKTETSYIFVYDGTNFVLLNRARAVSEVKDYDSGATADNTQRSVSDTDAIQGPSLTESAVIETEDIASFGRVYKVGKLAAIKITYTMNATQGVAFQVRYSDTAPTRHFRRQKFREAMLSSKRKRRRYLHRIRCASQPIFLVCAIGWRLSKRE